MSSIYLEVYRDSVEEIAELLIEVANQITSSETVYEFVSDGFVERRNSKRENDRFVYRYILSDDKMQKLHNGLLSALREERLDDADRLLNDGAYLSLGTAIPAAMEAKGPSALKWLEQHGLDVQKNKRNLQHLATHRDGDESIAAYLIVEHGFSIGYAKRYGNNSVSRWAHEYAKSMELSQKLTRELKKSAPKRQPPKASVAKV